MSAKENKQESQNTKNVNTSKINDKQTNDKKEIKKTSKTTDKDNLRESLKKYSNENLEISSNKFALIFKDLDIFDKKLTLDMIEKVYARKQNNISSNINYDQFLEALDEVAVMKGVKSSVLKEKIYKLNGENINEPLNSYFNMNNMGGVKANDENKNTEIGF